MKRAAVCLMSCLLLMAFSSLAMAGEEKKSTDKPDGYYLTLLGGGAFLSDADLSVLGESSKLTAEYSNGFLAGLALGYKHDTQRLEAEFSYQMNDFDTVSYMGTTEQAKGDQTAATFLLNYYFDIPTRYVVKPFLTAGIGAARIGVNDFQSTGTTINASLDDHDIVFAYQFGLGFTWAMSRNLDLELKYRYFGTLDPEFSDSEIEVGSNDVLLGLRIAL